MRTSTWKTTIAVLAVAGAFSASCAMFHGQGAARGPSAAPPACPMTLAGLECDELVIVPVAGVTAGGGRAMDTRGLAGESSRGPGAGPVGLIAKDGDGQTVGEFPLEHTDVAAEVSGFLASTRVTQTYANPFRDTIEAVYVFPLPETAAVHDFLMVAGGRRIRGVVRLREEAERIYKDARAHGWTASLLTQERPNVFTQNVANIEPGGRVEIEITYFHTLPYDKGWYEYVFPMVVAPRYCPDSTPDAARIAPPVLGEGERSGHDIGLSVRIEAGVPIDEIVVPTHDVKVERPAGDRAVVTLAEHDAIPNRDLVLRFKVAGGAPRVGAIAHRTDAGGFFSLMLVPPLDPADADVTPREITFLIDVSGSQQGLPLQMSQDIVLKCLDRLRPQDRFNCMYFESGNGSLWDEARPVTPANVAAAKRFVERLKGGGGTEMLAGLARALRARRDPRHVGMVVFFTDGQIGNEAEILRLVKEERGDTRVFCFGTGSSVNRYLIEGINEHGGGSVFYALTRDPEAAPKAVEHFFRAIDAPVLVDVGVDFGGLPVTDVYPTEVRDLFTGRPIVLTGRYTGAARGTIAVTGRCGGRHVRIPLEVSLPAWEAENAAMAPVWARARIEDLSRRQIVADDAGKTALAEETLAVALEFNLVSAYTAFVAVDESRIVGDGSPIQVPVPVELPADASREGTLGNGEGLSGM